MLNIFWENILFCSFVALNSDKVFVGPQTGPYSPNESPYPPKSLRIEDLFFVNLRFQVGIPSLQNPLAQKNTRRYTHKKSYLKVW